VSLYQSITELEMLPIENIEYPEALIDKTQKLLEIAA
jgi:hypothetical protein